MHMYIYINICIIHTSYVYTIYTYVYLLQIFYIRCFWPKQEAPKTRSAQPEISPSFVKATNCTHRKKDRPYAMKGASLGSAKVS